MVMSDDDDDAEQQVSAVEDYYLLDALKQPVCFSTLPLRLGDSDGDDVPESKKRLVLWGMAEAGVKVFREVVAWRLGLQGKQPEVAVLPVEGSWITLVKPKNSYEETVRTILITVQMLHFLRRKPDEPEKNLWTHLRKVFDKFDVRPSEDDFRNHRSLIKQVAENDPVLAKSEILQAFIEGRSRKHTNEICQDNTEIKQPFIADDEDIDEMVADDNDNESDEEDDDLFDSICAICDNGGDLLCCDGPCMRSFHAKEGAGDDSYCETLGYTEAQIEAMKKFLCKNCEYKQHQCFICGALESSEGPAAKVFLCNNATCGHFYHPKCVAQQLHPNNRNEASELEKKIREGSSFTCPIHWCFHCKGLEDRTQEHLQFAVCRRCPKSYHRKCLPREISFEDIEEEDIITRAWELSKRILIYCLDHEIDSEIETPVRDHIKFPIIEKPAGFLKKRAQLPVKKKKRTYDDILDQPSEEPARMPVKVRVQESEKSKKTTRKVAVKSSSEHLADKPSKKKDKFLKEEIQLEPSIVKEASVSSPRSAKEQKQELVTLPASATRRIPLSSFPSVDSETDKRVIGLLEKETVSSLTLKDVSKKCIVPSTHVCGRKIDIVAQGKLERSVQAVEAALKMLENGGNVDDAKAVCEPEVLRQLAKWHTKLRVYISPFIHGTRYSSFGRHFTKVEKLVEIVDKLHWYVEPGDMIVDFCCGANDFSRLMKEKLDQVQKKCHFKNYDLIQPQNRFCFEKRDWMTVKPKELPCHGSQLIMGLNPPFGVKASLANKFIDKALTFKPKLIILIVPKETKRLDQKKTPYDLVWEDSECLAGKAFYLPGSVDQNDKIVEGWNASAPPLYLWSRPDWTKKHKKIAEEHNHTCEGKKTCHIEEVNLSDDLFVKKEAESSDKLNARPGQEKRNTGKMSSHHEYDNLSVELPVRKQAEAANKRNSGSGKERETNNTPCNIREDMVLDERSTGKQTRSGEEKETLGKKAFHSKSDNLPVKRKAEATVKELSLTRKGKEGDRDESRSSDNSRKWTPDKVDSLPPEKQVEVAYEEPCKKSIHKEQRHACCGDGGIANRNEPKSARQKYEQRVAGMSDIKFREGGDSDMSISSPDNSNARNKSRSHSPLVPTEHYSGSAAYLDSYTNCPAKEPYASTVDRATYEGSYLARNDEYGYLFKRENDPRFYAEIDDNSAKRHAGAPTGDLYSLQSRGDNGYRRQISEQWNTAAAERSVVGDMPMHGNLPRYAGQIGDSYLQAGRIPPAMESNAHPRMHGGTGADDLLQARYSLGSSGARFGQPASTPCFGFSGGSASRGSVMDKYSYGLSGPSGLQSSVMDKYAPPLDGANKRPTSFLPRQGSSGSGWQRN
ncbi:hypothetical protein ACP70R_028284 [Stipagrostis hirtigluma subsp. patula]